MKKIFIVFVIMFVIVFCVSSTDYIFRSGDSNIHYRIFYRAVVYNYSGYYMTVNGYGVNNGRNYTVYSDTVYIRSSSAMRMDVKYETKGSVIYIYIIKK